MTQLPRFGSLLHLTLLVCAMVILATCPHARAQDNAPQQPVDSPQVFASPDEAVKALRAATQADDRVALRKLFGPEFTEILTGDAVEDTNNVKAFAARITQSYHLVKVNDDNLALQVGPDNWPFPIPLVKVNGQWHFDTAAGKEELIDRHIGKDELNAIGFCRAYVAAQQQYATMNLGSKYAQHIHSAPGKMDGLYWPPVKNGPVSPFGALLIEAQAEGYSIHDQGTGPHPFHGYYFKILTRQGASAPGGKRDYMSNGNLTGGFALVAYPVHWGKSGVMTFLVNQDGKVYQRNLGVMTSVLADFITEYDPTGPWVLVSDKGVLTR
jgi:hypothetical protein